VFWINVPIGTVLAVLAARFVPGSRDGAASRSFDLSGAPCVTSGLGLLVYAVVEAPAERLGDHARSRPPRGTKLSPTPGGCCCHGPDARGLGSDLTRF
jgi:hypothetical protein